MFTNSNHVQDTANSTALRITSISEQGFQAPISEKYLKQAKGQMQNSSVIVIELAKIHSFGYHNKCHEDKHNLATSWSTNMLSWFCKGTISK